MCTSTARDPATRPPPLPPPEVGIDTDKCHSLTDHRIDCKLKTKIANNILLLYYLDKIRLTLTGGFWQALANLYSEVRLYKGAREAPLSQLHYVLQSTPL
jgi:hypothetical protein